MTPIQTQRDDPRLTDNGTHVWRTAVWDGIRDKVWQTLGAYPQTKGRVTSISLFKLGSSEHIDSNPLTVYVSVDYESEEARWPPVADEIQGYLDTSPYNLRVHIEHDRSEWYPKFELLIIKSRWHVPLQIFTTALALLGYALGHLHKGRQFNPKNVHAKAANPLFFLMAAQIVLGAYLKLHLERGIHGRIRPVIRLLHSINGKAFPVYAWVQIIFGGITALGFCQGDHVGQCLAHFIMGGAFIAYGVLLTILLLVGQLWLRRTGRSQEFFDSAASSHSSQGASSGGKPSQHEGFFEELPMTTKPRPASRQSHKSVPSPTPGQHPPCKCTPADDDATSKQGFYREPQMQSDSLL